MTWAYLSLTFFLAVTPGATTAVVIRHTLVAGRRRGLAAAAGAAAGNATQAVVALVGVSALVATHPSALRLLSLLGALVLGSMGVTSVIRSLGVPRVPGAPGEPRAPRPAFREGLWVNLLNPSITAFYVAVVPSFLPPGAGWRVASSFYLAHIGIAMACHVVWASVFHQARLLFAGERARRWLDAAVGGVLLWLATRVLAR